MEEMPRHFVEKFNAAEVQWSDELRGFTLDHL